METQHQIMGYDRAATLFSPDGRLLQVEYADKAVRLGPASVGMICSDGVILLADRRIKDSLLVPNSLIKVYEIDNHVIGTAAGILSDARVLIEKAQVFAQQHRVTYDTPADTETIMKEMSNIKQKFTQYGGVRPFGVSLMIAGVDEENECKLFISDVTGNYFGFKASAIGENEEKIKELLKKQYKDSLTIEHGIKVILNILKKVLGKEFDLERFELAYIKTKGEKLVKLEGQELAKFLK
ncbi:proteasome subunit alpha [Candidatus Pacearchaeota archaeon CG_4_9_14_3_um_filter_31_7]|nr:MAG: proteasome subunit alpha [Candidatus Pacearchaeota archaeon CG1_02_31_27]PIN92572.1 MAG: proteasome subunit alpha [Candidatus Pacearchaeota archaeon CG10_big_fil_rev_8_21_14_0_10_31_59]PIZ80744.1 MAG: proteasome subunit alpha [Candidatus Pacearchaeota archaeon CG_4_10_14_0_2_um_filter_31_10]PJA70696.1 MAG: proteasome subunit alpha [Candidatus Pacearchaeota archaeon CG_4_9_14_3_um_filter_31_7]